MSPYLSDILAVIILIALNGLFASLELAVLTIDRDEVHKQATGGNRRARLVQGFLNDSSRFLATIQIAITLSGFLASATGAAALAAPLATLVSTAVPRAGAYAHVISIVLVTLVITYVTLVFGELVPKRLGMQLPQRIAYGLARPVSVIARVLSPVNTLLTWTTNSTLRLLGVPLERPRRAMTEEDVRRLLRERAKIPRDELELIGRVFEFGDHVAREIMIPRTQMVTVEGQVTLREALKVVMESAHSRMPVTGETVDDVVGLIGVKDLLPRVVAGDLDMRVEECMRPVLFFPDTKLTTDLLREMQLARAELVVLIDEYGGVAGLITVEDLVEELVGEIRDATDPVELAIEQVDDNTYVVGGATDLEAVNSQLGLKLDTRTAYETIGGYILSELGHIPEPGEELKRTGVIYRVLEMSDKRIDSIQVTIPKEPAVRDQC